MAFLSFSSRHLVSFKKYSLHLTPMHSGFKHILVLLNKQYVRIKVCVCHVTKL